MKNLFYYAKKELSQDALLLWIFDNYQDEIIGCVARELLTEFCKLKADEIIEELSVYAQWKRIDVSVFIKTNLRNVGLFIEDKTFTNVHNQLSVYDKAISQYEIKYGKENIYKVFYKTSVIDNTDTDNIQSINRVNLQNNGSEWVIYDIKSIFKLFENYSNCGNLILEQYIDYLKKIFDLVNNCELPRNSKTQEDFISWKIFFNNAVVPKLNIPDIKYSVKVYRGKFTYLQVFKDGYDKYPYLEFRSCDLVNGKVKARLLCYGVEDNQTTVMWQKKTIEAIKQDKIFDSKRIVTKRNGKDILPKQIAVSHQNLSYKTVDDLVNCIRYYAEYYLKLMKSWRK